MWPSGLQVPKGSVWNIEEVFGRNKNLGKTIKNATVRMMMMIIRSTLILGKTCLTESAPFLRWLGIDQTFHCYSLFSNHSAVTQDTVLLLCFLRVFPFLFCVCSRVSFLLICASFWILPGLEKSLHSRQRAASCWWFWLFLAIFCTKDDSRENLEVDFVLLLHSSTPEPNKYRP